MNSPDSGQTLTAKDADFLARCDTGSKAGLYLEGADRARSRRMLALGMVAGGRLDPKRYAVLTSKGRAFVENMRSPTEAPW